MTRESQLKVLTHLIRSELAKDLPQYLFFRLDDVSSRLAAKLLAGRDEYRSGRRGLDRLRDVLWQALSWKPKWGQRRWDDHVKVEANVCKDERHAVPCPLPCNACAEECAQTYRIEIRFDFRGSKTGAEEAGRQAASIVDGEVTAIFDENFEEV